MSNDRDPGLIGQATRTERFAVLHEVAARLLDDLEREYLVERATGLDLDPHLNRAMHGEQVVRLVPISGDGAPLTVLFTNFPGLVVRFGRWTYEPFPACGCDYCNDDPDEVARNFVTKTQVLAAGRFTERRGDVSFQAPDWSQRGYALSAEPPADLPDVPPSGWSPWIRRTAGNGQQA